MEDRRVKSIELVNEAGFRVGLLDYGATISSIKIPVDGRILDVVLGYPNPGDYLHDNFYLGATVGRYAGRIDHGCFTLNGRRYHLATGENIHCLHGGPQGFSKRFWSVDSGSDSKSAILRYQSADGDQGFPGRLEMSVRYSLSGDSGLLIEYRAESDAETVINLTNHAYFNLTGGLDDLSSGITNHAIVINADCYAVLSETDIPTGELRDVTGSRFDFRQVSWLGGRVGANGFGSNFGYDHSFLLNGSGDGPVFAAAAHSPESGLWLKVHTTQPALQFYTGEYLGAPLRKRGGFCFEAQNFPDAPNQPLFPSSVLHPGQVHAQSIFYEFGCADSLPP